jgi:siroheme synthase (precorrin-2 oxidase/ferrochelatase)
VNRADVDEEEPGDFSIPAQFRPGALGETPSVVVSVSCESPALSARIRDGLAQRWDPRWSTMAALMQQLRPMIRRSGWPISQRRSVLRDLASDAAMDALAGGTAALLAWLALRHPQVSLDVLGRLSQAPAEPAREPGS